MISRIAFPDLSEPAVQAIVTWKWIKQKKKYVSKCPGNSTPITEVWSEKVRTIVFPVPRGPRIKQELLSPVSIVRRISPRTFLFSEWLLLVFEKCTDLLVSHSHHSRRTCSCYSCFGHDKNAQQSKGCWAMSIVSVTCIALQDLRERRAETVLQDAPRWQSLPMRRVLLLTSVSFFSVWWVCAWVCDCGSVVVLFLVVSCKSVSVDVKKIPGFLQEVNRVREWIRKSASLACFLPPSGQEHRRQSHFYDLLYPVEPLVHLLALLPVGEPFVLVSCSALSSSLFHSSLIFCSFTTFPRLLWILQEPKKKWKEQTASLLKGQEIQQDQNWRPGRMTSQAE